MVKAIAWKVRQLRTMRAGRRHRPLPRLAARCPVERPLEAPKIVTAFLSERATKYEEAFRMGAGMFRIRRDSLGESYVTFRFFWWRIWFYWQREKNGGQP